MRQSTSITGSVRWSVGRSVGRSVSRSVGLLVCWLGNAFVRRSTRRTLLAYFTLFHIIMIKQILLCFMITVPLFNEQKCLVPSRPLSRGPAVVTKTPLSLFSRFHFWIEMFSKNYNYLISSFCRVPHNWVASGRQVSSGLGISRLAFQLIDSGFARRTRPSVRVTSSLTHSRHFLSGQRPKGWCRL